MEQRIYHGNLTPSDISESLIAHFNRGNLRAQQLGDSDRLIVQIGTRPGAMAGGDTTVSVILQKVADGVAVQLGQQAWLGIAASLGTTALSAIRNPFNLLGRLDDLAQDIQNLQINEQVWQAIDDVARAAGASQELIKSFAPGCLPILPDRQPGWRTKLHRLWCTVGRCSTSHLPKLWFCAQKL